MSTFSGGDPPSRHSPAQRSPACLPSARGGLHRLPEGLCSTPWTTPLPPRRQYRGRGPQAVEERESRDLVASVTRSPLSSLGRAARNRYRESFVWRAPVVFGPE